MVWKECILNIRSLKVDITRARANTNTVVTDTADSTVSATWKEGNNFIPVPDSIVSIIEVFPFTDKSNLNLFDVRYQLRLNDLYDFSSTSVLHYDMTMRHLDFLDSILVGEKNQSDLINTKTDYTLIWIGKMMYLLVSLF